MRDNRVNPSTQNKGMFYVSCASFYMSSASKTGISLTISGAWIEIEIRCDMSGMQCTFIQSMNTFKLTCNLFNLDPILHYFMFVSVHFVRSGILSGSKDGADSNTP
jgi:hypothetical protein